VLEKVDPGDGGTFAATGLPCWCWLGFAGTGGEGPAAYGECSVHFDTHFDLLHFSFTEPCGMVVIMGQLC
jgi:hypothetical protein